MVFYKLLVKKSAEKELRNIPKQTLFRIVSKIRALAADPRPNGCQALAGSRQNFRVRQNDYRIVYTVNDTKKEVIVVKVGHRSDVYK